MRFLVHFARPENLLESGPFLKVVLNSPFEPVPYRSPMLFALIDTGASMTCVLESFLINADFIHHGRQKAMVPGVAGMKYYSVYYIGLTILGDDGEELQTFANLPVLGVPAVAGDYEVIIGRDFLRQGQMYYDGEKGEITITTPDRGLDLDKPG